MPTASITASASTICSGTDVTFTATTVSSAQYRFLVNGNEVQNSGSATYHSPSFANGDMVKVEVTALGCTQTSPATMMVVNASPVVSLTSSKSEACQGDQIILTASSGSSTYNFLYKNGGVWTSLQNNGSNVYSATLSNSSTVRAVATSASGCLSTTNDIVLTMDALPSSVSIDPFTAVCAGQSLTLTATATGATQYAFLVNGTVAQAKSPANTFTSVFTNNQLVTAIAYSAQGCSTQSASEAVTVNSAPVVTLVANKTSQCSGETLTFTSSTGDSYNFMLNG